MRERGALRSDHVLLRQKLQLLESTLHTSPEARTVLREMCGSLLRLLQQHIRNEESVLRPSGHYLGAPPPIPHVHDHISVAATLRAVHDLLQQEWKASVPLVVLRLSQVIEQLREEMDEQERTVLAPTADENISPRLRASAISGWMSVNEILQLFPTTEPVFDRLRVNRLYEGYESVDEVAWRHGVQVADMLVELRRLATAFPRY